MSSFFSQLQLCSCVSDFCSNRKEVPNEQERIPAADGKFDSEGLKVITAVAKREAEGDDLLDELEGRLERVVPGFPLFHLSLHQGETIVALEDFYGICRQAKDLIVTTSCHAVWKKGGCTNRFGKVIPAVPTNGAGSPRVFFFDDNINLHLGPTAGLPDSKGLCNLRDVVTGTYVNFTEGVNGFVCENAFRHTLIHSSTKYRNVLIQANILDAVLHEDYFSSIIAKHRLPGENIIVYMDVNGTILSNDTIMGLDSDQMLLSTMCGFVEVRPRSPCDFTWLGDTVRLEGPILLKNLMSDLQAKRSARNVPPTDHKLFQRDHCGELLRGLDSVATLGWCREQASISGDDFLEAFDGHLKVLRESGDVDGAAASSGLTKSWLKCVAALRADKQTLVLNSFGVDTHRVLAYSRPDPERTLHLAVNYELWSDRDKNQFHQQLVESSAESNNRKSATAKEELRPSTCKLQVASCKLQAASYKHAGLNGWKS